MKKFLIILLVGICSLSAFVVFAETNFGQNLSMGSSGTDVFNLQKLLNSDSETQVSDSGEGSPGKETNYFGKKTKTALEKFQTKYSDNVLKPLGLTTATGFLGQTTRTFINEHFGTTTEETSTEEKKVPVIKAVKPKFISKLGATTTIIADHLSETNRSTNNIELETYDDLVAEDGSVSFILKLSFIHKLKNEIALNNDVLKKLQEQDESLGKEFFLNMVADTIQGIEIVDGKKVLPIKFVVSNFYGDSKSFKAYLDIVSLLR